MKPSRIELHKRNLMLCAAYMMYAGFIAPLPWASLEEMLKAQFRGRGR